MTWKKLVKKQNVNKTRKKKKRIERKKESRFLTEKKRRKEERKGNNSYKGNIRTNSNKSGGTQLKRLPQEL